MHGRVRAAASLGFVLAAQARKLPLLVCLAWAEEAQKRHARNSDGDAAIIEVLSYCTLRVFGRFACLSWYLADRAGGKIGLATATIFSGAPPPGYAVLRAVRSRERGCCPGRHSLWFTIYRLGGDCR